MLTFWALLKDTVSLQFFGADERSWQQNYFFNEQNVPDSLHWLFELLVFLFQSVVTLLMLNLLIAMMNSTYSEYHLSKREFLVMERYNIILAYGARKNPQQRSDTRTLLHHYTHSPIKA